MKAIAYDSFGSAHDVLHLRDVDITDPQPGEVRVVLQFSGVNPSDVKSRAGRPDLAKPAFDLIIPHSDGSGVIEAVGAGVDGARVGERVWIWNGQWQRAFGTAATHITLPSAQAVALPDGVDLKTGAVLGIPGLTACHAVFGSGDVAGLTVLVQGGGGTVGLLAVQLAKWGGARVIATASARDHDRVRDAGADVVLDYTSSDLVTQIMAANSGALVDRIVEVEFGPNITVDAEVIAPNGTIAAYGSAKNLNPTLPFFPLLFKAVTIDIILIYLLPLAERSAAIRRLNKALEDKALHCPVEKILPLSDTATGHRMVEAGGRSGAILLACDA